MTDKQTIEKIEEIIAPYQTEIELDCLSLPIAIESILERKEQECERLKEEMFAHFHKTSEVPTLLGFTIDDIANLVKENNTLRQYKKSKQASYEEMQKRWQEAEKYSRKLESELSEAKKMLEFYQGCFAGKGGKQ